MRDTCKSNSFKNYVPMSELLTLLRGQYSKQTVYRWVSRGMPHKRLGGKLWFSEKEIFRWLESEYY